MIFEQENIMYAICSYYNVNTNDLIVRDRTARIIRIKHMYFYLCSKFTTLSLQAIGKTAKVDHATVIYAKSKIESQIKIYRNIWNDFENLKLKLTENTKLIPIHIDLLRITENYTRTLTN